MHGVTTRAAFDLTAWSVVLLAGLMLGIPDATADGMVTAPPNARWRAECGSCHVAFPPQLLAAPAWQRIMSQLDRHFGVDASVDPAAALEIGAYLERHAGPERRTAGSAGNLRITGTRRFAHEHEEVPATAWKVPAVKSAANCAACHSTADQGDFRERNIRIPR